MLVPRGALAALLLSGCETDPTQLVVVVATDMPIPAELVGYRLQVTSQDRQDRLGPGGMTVPLVSDEDLPDSFGVRPKGGDASRRVEVDVTAMGADGRDLFTTSARTHFLEGQRLRLDMFLPRRCVRVDCGGELTCRQGECVDPAIDPHDLAEWDPSAEIGSGPDAGTDASAPPDAGTDASAPADAGRDAASADAGADPGADAGLDAGADSGLDAGAGCDPLPNGCPGSACRVTDDGSTWCGPTGSGVAGDLCLTDDDCGAELECVHEAGSAGVCRPYCRDGSDCDALAGEHCLEMTDVRGEAVPVAGYCSMACFPADCANSFECSLGTARTFGDGTPIDARMCRPFGTAVEDEQCDDAIRCEPGQACYRAAGRSVGLCRPYCDDGDSCQDPDAVCIAFLDDGEPLEWGTCSSPCNPDLGEPCGPAEQDFTCSLESVRNVFGNGTRAIVCQQQLAAGAGQCGDACISAADCLPGFACDSGGCAEVCVVGQNATCVGGLCLALDPPVLLSPDSFGLCDGGC